jgi:hypothetical protein
MKLDIVAGSQNDEFYTPKYAVIPLLKYLKPSSTIWCPFDTDQSNFVRVLSAAGHDVLASHIFSGFDFFSTPTLEVDYIISNPPYSLKTEVLERLFSLHTPFAMLLGVVGLFESQRRFNIFKNNKFEVMYFNKRISYMKDMSTQISDLNPPFSSVYITQNVLPDRLVFEEIKK